MLWKDGIVGRLNSGVSALLKKAGVKTVLGWAHLRDGKTAEVETEIGLQVIRAEQVVIATGSDPIELPFLPFGGKVISSTGALALPETPGNLVIVGAGYIGLELGPAFAKLGSKVTIVEAQSGILPQYDADLTRPVAKRLRELGVEVLTDAKAKGLAPAGGALSVEAADGRSMTLAADNILVTVGRKPVTEGWGLDAIDLDMDGPFIRIDDKCHTSMRGIYAIGDVTGEPMLAPGQWHKARWWQRSSPVKDAFGIRFAFRQSASLILRLLLLVFRLRRSGPPASRSTLATFRSEQMAAP